MGEMATYDYRSGWDPELDGQLDTLSSEERKRLDKAVQQIRQESQQQAAERAGKQCGGPETSFHKRTSLHLRSVSG